MDPDDDADGDGIADDFNKCLLTITGETVDSIDCSVSDLCPSDINWKKHSACARCVVHTSEDFVAAGLIMEVGKNATVPTAGMSMLRNLIAYVRSFETYALR